MKVRRMSQLLDRRDFLKSTGALAGAMLPYWFTAESHRALGFQSVNERPVLGCIGMGGRGRGVCSNALSFFDCVAVCDVDRNHVGKAQEQVTEIQHQKGHSKQPEMYEDYRQLLDRKDIDVVVIATPDHWHTKIAIDAMRAGKDVYCEKPLTLTIHEGKQIIKVLDETKRVFQVGTQQRSEGFANEKTIQAQFVKAVAMARSGRLGKIIRVTCGVNRGESSGEIPHVAVPQELNWDMWLGQAPLTDYLCGPTASDMPSPQTRAHFQFRWWYEYSGGKMTDWGAHHVDIGMWALQMDNSGPISVEGTAIHPVPLRHGIPTISNRYNVATEFLVTCKFADGAELLITSEGDNGVLIEGTEGRIFVNRYKLTGAPVETLVSNPLSESLLQELSRGKPPRSGNNAHMENFFHCIQDRGLPISDVYSHHRAMTTCHLANIAIRLGRKIEWDPATQQIINDPEAATWIAREQRKGYEIDVRV